MKGSAQITQHLPRCAVFCSQVAQWIVFFFHFFSQICKNTAFWNIRYLRYFIDCSMSLFLKQVMWVSCLAGQTSFTTAVAALGPKEVGFCVRLHARWSDCSRRWRCCVKKGDDACCRKKMFCWGITPNGRINKLTVLQEIKFLHLFGLTDMHF